MRSSDKGLLVFFKLTECVRLNVVRALSCRITRMRGDRFILWLLVNHVCTSISSEFGVHSSFISLKRISFVLSWKFQFLTFIIPDNKLSLFSSWLCWHFHYLQWSHFDYVFYLFNCVQLQHINWPFNSFLHFNWQIKYSKWHLNYLRCTHFSL